MKKLICIVSMIALICASVVCVNAGSGKTYMDSSGSGYKGSIFHYERAKINFDRSHVTPNGYVLSAMVCGLAGEVRDDVIKKESYVNWMKSAKSFKVDTESFYIATTGAYRVCGSATAMENNSPVYYSYDSGWRVG